MTRINHCVIKNNRVMYEVEYESMKNKPNLELLAYEQMTQECKELVPKYYEKELLIARRASEQATM